MFFYVDFFGDSFLSPVLLHFLEFLVGVDEPDQVDKKLCLFVFLLEEGVVDDVDVVLYVGGLVGGVVVEVFVVVVEEEGGGVSGEEGSDLAVAEEEPERGVGCDAVGDVEWEWEWGGGVRFL